MGTCQTQEAKRQKPAARPTKKPTPAPKSVADQKDSSPDKAPTPAKGCIPQQHVSDQESNGKAVSPVAADAVELSTFDLRLPSGLPSGAGPKDYPQVNTLDEFEEMVRKMYTEDYCGFATKYNAAVEMVKPRPDGTDDSVWEDWKGKGIDHMCDFFRSWYKWTPSFTKGDGLAYIQKFSWIYSMSRVGLNFVTTYPGTEVTRQFVVLRGAWMDSEKSIPLANRWVEDIGSAMSEYIIPDGGYKSYNQFFKRSLKKPRPVSGACDKAMCVSPADAIVNMIDDCLTLDQSTLSVKTQRISVGKLLNDSMLAAKFVGGTALSCILMPDVYHHYHAPIQGEVVEAHEDVAGNYFGIENFPAMINEGDVGYGYDYSVFEHFRRGYIIIKTERYGHVAMIPVGLNTVSTVVFKEEFKKVTLEDKPVPIAKGDEVGYFQYGGSMCILLFERGVFPSVRIPQGQLVGKLIPRTPFSVEARF